MLPAIPAGGRNFGGMHVLRWFESLQLNRNNALKALIYAHQR